MASNPPAHPSPSWNILDYVQRAKMSQDHKTVLLMALLRWIDPAQPPLEWSGHLFMWKWPGWDGGHNQIICGWRLTALSPIYHCLLFYLYLLKLKISMSQGIEHGLTPNFYPVNIIFSNFISVNFNTFCAPQSFAVWNNSEFCVAAIHQRLESDGTERVEGSMTQRLENILNRKLCFH